MAAVICGVSRIVGVGPTLPRKAATGKGWFVRFIDALAEARMRQAHREIMRHAHLLPYSLDERGNRLVRVGGKDMPFGA
jgi:hypothetical protein